MSRRKLKRQLGLLQVVMLGTAGTLAAEIFVLTGHAVSRSGTDAVLALLLGGVLSFTFAINYCELASTYPVAGGAMSYVRESFGSGFLSFLVGSMMCGAGTFYAALSAVGFAYSLQVLFPMLPILPVAAAAVLLVVALHLVGVSKVGKIQVILGAILLVIFGAYIIIGLTHPQGFSWATYIAANTYFADQRTLPRIGRLFVTIALVYNAYVGFEVIADDAEEIRDPDRIIPRAILISLTACTIIYVLTAYVTLGTLPFALLADSETALSDAAGRFMPGIGEPIMAMAGLVATLTSVNSAMLSATRAAFTLSRDGAWPRAVSKLNRFRSPSGAVVVVGILAILVTLSRQVDFLSYLSSVGFLFVLFWSNLSLPRLRKQYPDLRRPFKVPLYPFTAYLAPVICVALIAFADRRAVISVAGVLALFSVAYVARGYVAKLITARRSQPSSHDDCIVIAADNADTARGLVHLGSILAQTDPDSYICAVSIQTDSQGKTQSFRSTRGRAGTLGPVYREAQARNVAFYVKVRDAKTVADGVLAELAQRENVRILLTGWPTPLDPEHLAENPVKRLLQHSPTHMAVLLDRGLRQVRRILVPVGGGPHSRLAIHLAQEIALSTRAQITALRVITTAVESDEEEDNLAILQEVLEEELGQVLPIWTPLVTQACSVADGILEETSRVSYDLVVIGASEEWPLGNQLFGAVDDWIADKVSCSVLLCRRHESLALSWVRRQVKVLYRERQTVPEATASAAPQAL